MKRIILTIHADGTATAKGYFVDYRDAVNSITRTYASETAALDEFQAMRNRNAEFSYTINRKA